MEMEANMSDSSALLYTMNYRLKNDQAQIYSSELSVLWFLPSIVTVFEAFQQKRKSLITITFFIYYAVFHMCHLLHFQLSEKQDFLFTSLSKKLFDSKKGKRACSPLPIKFFNFSGRKINYRESTKIIIYKSLQKKKYSPFYLQRIILSTLNIWQCCLYLLCHLYLCG